MPTKTDKFPGSWLSQQDWREIADGDVWFFANEEMNDHNTKAATVRVTAHTYARDNGFKFRTKYVNGEGLYLQRRDDKERPAPSKTEK